MRLSIVTAAFAYLIAISAHGGQEARMPEQDPRTPEEVERVFDSIDRDNDDRISKRESERVAIVRDRFDGVDADEDGYLSRAEYRARPRNEAFE